ncbi:MAG: hypothetical protein IJQ84_00395 [Paludibacteraceae bacterium]|nr:hypothetical protein [Paludibacteraceae bacterium]
MENSDTIGLEFISFLLKSFKPKEKEWSSIEGMAEYLKKSDLNGILLSNINLHASYPIYISGQERNWKPDIELTFNDGKIIFIEVTHHIENVMTNKILSSYSAILKILGKENKDIIGGILCALSDERKYNIFNVINNCINQNVNVFKQKLGDKGAEIAIFQVRPDVPMPQQILEDAIGKYVGDSPYSDFVPGMRNESGIRVIIKGINNLEFNVPEGA